MERRNKAVAAGWGDNSGGRPSYTVDQINEGVLFPLVSPPNPERLESPHSKACHRLMTLGGGHNYQD